MKRHLFRSTFLQGPTLRSLACQNHLPVAQIFAPFSSYVASFVTMHIIDNLCCLNTMWLSVDVFEQLKKFGAELISERNLVRHGPKREYLLRHLCVCVCVCVYDLQNFIFLGT